MCISRFEKIGGNIIIKKLASFEEVRYLELYLYDNAILLKSNLCISLQPC